mmetsp:Transcript_20910/g.48203  ORF Transcript_20910/g.48203 Transcript_20910/m.48203 type:complete len:111 (+) Transcript_20910:1004-1336(+)
MTTAAGSTPRSIGGEASPALALVEAAPPSAPSPDERALLVRDLVDLELTPAIAAQVAPRVPDLVSMIRRNEIRAVSATLKAAGLVQLCERQRVLSFLRARHSLHPVPSIS